MKIEKLLYLRESFIMKYLAIIYLVIFSHGSTAQEATQQDSENNSHRWEFGINICPDYCSRTLIAQDGNEQAASLKGSMNSHLIAKIGYTTGLSITRIGSRNIGIEAGIAYSSKGYAHKISDLTFGDPIDPRYGFVYSTDPSIEPSEPVKLVYNYNYLDITFRIFKTFGNRKLKFVTGIGMASNIFLNASVTSVGKYSDGQVKRKTRHDNVNDYNSVCFSPLFSIGLDYHFNKKIHLKAEPTFRYGILTTHDGWIKEYLWNAGLNFTFCYALK